MNQIEEDKNLIAGEHTACEIVKCLGSLSQKKFMEKACDEDEELVSTIKNELFFFDDITKLCDRDMQFVLRDTDSKLLAKALKAAKPEVCAKFFRNMSKEAVKLLQEDMEFMGPIPLKDALECQQQIVNTVYRLESQGQVVIIRNKEEFLV